MMKPRKQIHHDILGFFLRTNNNEQFFYKLKFTIMKKVFTLVSALSMVAGSAVAHDYNWNFNDSKLVIGEDGLKDLSKEGNVNVTKDGLEFAQGSDNYVKFTAQENDIVTVTAAGSTGSFYVKVGASTYDAKISENTSLKVTVPADGAVQIWASEGVTIKAIVAQSEAYRTVNQAIDDTREILNRRVNDVAPYVNVSSDFYLGVKKQYNDQGEKLEKVVADLKELVAKNEVANNVSGQSETGKTQLINALDEIKKSIGTQTKLNETSPDEEKGSILVAAQNAKAAYDDVINAKATEVAAAKDEISKRKATKVDGDKYSIFKAVKDSKGNITSWTPKWTGVDKTYKTYVEDEYDTLKKGALEELGKYPNHDFGAYAAKYNVVVTHSKNVVARYEFENEKTIVSGQKDTNLAFIGGLGSVADALVTLSADNSKLFDNAGLADKKAEAEALSAKIKQADNKHTISDLEGEFKTPAESLSTLFDSKKTAWGTKAQEDLDATIKAKQAKLDDYSYKVTSQYQNDVETLKKYQAEFAKLQNQIDAVKKDISDVSTPAKAYNVAKDWKTNDKKLSDVDTQLNKLWSDTQNAENAAIIQKNNDAVTDLEKKVENARTYYQKAVAEVDKYRKADFFAKKSTTTDSGKLAVTQFAEDIKTLYDYSLQMENALKDAKALRDASNSGVVDGKPTAKLVDFTSYDNTIANSISCIENALKASKKEANDIAYNYYKTATTGACAVAMAYVVKVENNTSDYAVANKISGDAAVSDATTRFKVIKNGDNDEKGNLIDANNDLENASVKIENLKKDLTLALDVVGEKTVDAILANSKAAADAVLADVKKYDGMKKKIAHYQVEWSVAKAAADKSNTALQAKLEAFHKVLDADQATLEKTDKLNAVQADYDKKYEGYENELYDVTHFDVYQANVAAETAINDALTATKADLATAKSELAKLTKDAAKEILTNAITNAENVIAAVEADFTAAKADKKTGEKKDELIGRLTALKLADSIKAAQDKDKVVEGDLNGDGIVDENDLDAGKSLYDNEKMVDDEYSIFMSTYLKAIKK